MVFLFCIFCRFWISQLNWTAIPEFCLTVT